ncbi:MAG: ATP-grasp domain-containing protein [Methanomicrobia archaeon]|nr:ATP-grasp domain-containing protein [Methanomicrobia archaeon]
MRILVAEYAVGGGAGKNSSLLLEGNAMLLTLKRGFERLGHEVIYPSAERDFAAAVERLAACCDAGIVIAPDVELARLTRLLESKTVNLGCPPDFVEVCADKLRTSELLRAAGIVVPRIFTADDVGWFGTRSRAYISKPRYGCASENVLVLNEQQRGEPGSPYDNPDCFISEFIRGDDLSCSLIASRSSILPLTINKQYVRNENGRLKYCGGYVPYAIEEEIAQKIQLISMAVITTLGGTGYVGIDFVVDDSGAAYVVDINPRPTTSIIGIARVLNYEVADLLIRAKFDSLPTAAELKTEGVFEFKFS